MAKVTSFSIHAKSPLGFVIDFNVELEDGETPSVEAEKMQYILRKAGYEDTTSYASRKPAASSYQPAASQPVSQPVGFHTPASNSASFSAETLITEYLEGKAYHKVKGGRYSNYGVRIWPETLLAAGIDASRLDPRQPLSLSGYTAHFVHKQNGKIDKVVELVLG